MSRKKMRFDPQESARGRDLRDLLREASQHARAEQRVLDELPEAYRGHCRFGGVQDGELTLLVTAATTASLLRFQQAELLKRLRSRPGFEAVQRLRVKVAPMTRRPEPGTVKRRISPATSRLLRDQAEATDDPALRQVLLKLASHTD